jgi:hypothetical protein
MRSGLASHVHDSSLRPQCPVGLERKLRHAEISTEIFQKCGGSWEKKNHHPKTTLSPAIHHKFTTKNHHKTTRFLKNPLKKRPSATLEKNLQN